MILKPKIVGQNSEDAASDYRNVLRKRENEQIHHIICDLHDMMCWN